MSNSAYEQSSSQTSRSHVMARLIRRTFKRPARVFLPLVLAPALAIGSLVLSPAIAHAVVPSVTTPLPVGQTTPATMAMFGSTIVWDTLRSSDGGSTWERIDLPEGPSPAALCFTDATHGWAVGERLWWTSDGGATWAVEASGFAAEWGAPALCGIDALDADHAWAVGLGGVILSTVDSDDDTAAPSTVDDGDRLWHADAATVHLRVTDIGSSGVARTEYRVDGETTWRDGDEVPFNAPLDHRGDGEHWITYRSVDVAGNVEPARFCPVLIDTRGPQTWAHAARQVDRRVTVRFRYRVNDLLSPYASLRLVIYDYRTGSPDRRRVRKVIEKARVRTGRDLSLPFRLDLPAGDYWYDLYATDLAGNESPSPYHGMFKVR